MITLAEPDPYLLAESEERPTQQGDRESEKNTGSVYVLQPEEGAPKSHDKEQRPCSRTISGLAATLFSAVDVEFGSVSLAMIGSLFRSAGTGRTV
jgi:hypothetical protein